MELILKYFPSLDSQQKQRLEALGGLYSYWNSQINVISRKDMEHFYERHVLHSLAIAKVAAFEPSSRVMDVGTGGGFPGIPLAIFFPNSNFILVDSIGKKIKVVNEVTKELGLTNTEALHERAEEVDGKFNHIVSRAVTQMPKFLSWVKPKLLQTPQNARLRHAVWYLKGGDISEEMSEVRNYRLFELSEYFEEDFFSTKKVVCVPK